ncbi:MAG: AI-2E family transporter [Alphaproteobacteria bacterium]|nr:MAG: AI-2E family transporter [Alphaproteobacteria bacterium]
MSFKPLSPTTHLIFWSCACGLFLLSVILFKAVLLPFVLGIAVAYLLNPTVNKLGDIGIARAPAAMMILGGFLILILGFAGVLSPILYRELSQFSADLPQYIEKFWGLMSPVTARLDQYIGGADGETLETLLKKNAGSAVNAANYIVHKIASGGQAVMDMLSVAIFMPIVAYFMMKEWPSVTRWVRDLMPRHSEEVIMGLLKQIDQKLSGFVRGQITVAVFLGVAYAVMLSLAGLKYGFLIGLMSGLLSVIPMVGSAVGLIVSVAVAWFQSGDIGFVGLIAGIFIGGQLVEGNFLTPKLVGDSVGLHPLWVFFALLAGGSLLGVLGMFLAVPVAAVIGVLLAFAIQKYKESAYYRDMEVDPTDQKPAKKSIKKSTEKKSIKSRKPKTNKPKKSKA